MRCLLQSVLYLASFGLGRAILFLAPIFLANTLSARTYGILEFSQAVASVTATILSLGTSGTVPLAVVRKVASVSWDSILLHQAGLAFGALVLSLGSLLFGVSWSVRLPILLTAIIAQQGLWSVTLKSTGYKEASLFMDAGLWGSMAVLVLVTVGLSLPVYTRDSSVYVALILMLFGLSGWTLYSLHAADCSQALSQYASTLREGIPLMFAALLAIVATTSGRLGIGMLTSAETTALYAILFRVTAVPIVMHQVLVIANFRSFFAVSETLLHRRILQILWLVGMCVVLFWLGSEAIAPLFGQAFQSAFAEHRVAGLLILAQTVLWSGIALNDLVNNREQQAGPVARASTLYFLLSIPLAIWFMTLQTVTLERYVPVHSAIMLGYFCVQALAMFRAGIRLELFWATSISIFVAFSILAYFV